MRRKDKEPAEKSAGNRGPEDGEGAVRLRVPDGRPAREEALRRAQQAMHLNEPETNLPSTVDSAVEIESADPEEEWAAQEGRRRQVPVGFLVLGFLVTLGLVVWAVVVFRRGEVAAGNDFENLSERWDQERIETQEAEALLERIDEAVRHYLAADNVEDKSRYARDPERVAPLMTEHYKTHPLVPRTFLRVGEFASLGLEKRSFMVLSIQVEGVNRAEDVVSLVVEETEEGEVLIDWESEVACQPMPLEEYIASKPRDPIDFRVYLKKDNFYAFEFVDAKRYQSFILTERDSESYLFGYVERGSAAHLALEKLMDGSTTGQEPAIVRVRFSPETASSRSVLIEEIVAPRWLYAGE